ncbi:MAG: Hpt domain-containing protein [Rubrivivax sp.]|nr:Hpt domain-containing protein [Rubrivivax sp.]
MMSTAKAGTPSAEDLRALSWVQDELRRSLEAAHKALHRQLREAEALRGSDVDRVDPGVLRAARNHLHQAAGALELVGMPVPARFVRAAEQAVQRLTERPSLLTPKAVESIERASYALMDYIGRLTAGKQISGVALFPQYRSLLELAGTDRVHPADLWEHDWRWRVIAREPGITAQGADPQSREVMERLMLRLMRMPDRTTLRRLSDLSAALGADAKGRRATLWRLAAGFFEAQAFGLLRFDVHVKRAAPRLLAQARLGLRSGDVSDRLAHDLLFFCARANPGQADASLPRLNAVLKAYGLDDTMLPDYEAPALGRFDPAWIALARKRVGAAREAWSAVASGEMHRHHAMGEAFALVHDSLEKLYPKGGELGMALLRATQSVGSAGVPTGLAMEVATAVLYLEASLQDGDLDEPHLGERIQRLAQRIDAVRRGAEPQPLDPWMEELYRRVSDNQTMGSVVQELRGTLSEVEKQIDQFFRHPRQPELLFPVSGQLSAMRGVFSVLGLEPATQAILRMRDDVDQLARTPHGPESEVITQHLFERLADNLGALSFMIDILAVQPLLAKALFKFDPATGYLSALMGQPPRDSQFADSIPDTGPGDLGERAQRVGRDALRAEISDEVFSRELRSLAQQAMLAEERRLADTLTAAQAALERTGDPEQRRALRAELAARMQKLRPGAEPVPAPSAATARESRPAPLAEAAGLAGVVSAAAAAAGAGAGREADAPTQAPVPATGAAPQPAAAGAAGAGTTPVPVQAAPAPDGEDTEMLEVFLEEAAEVFSQAREAIARLDHDERDAGNDLSELTAIRRAFHTLKGSSRMVGLNEFGEAAWACEQLYNARLAHSPSMEPACRGFTLQALDYLEDWTGAIARRVPAGHHKHPVVAAADALRLDGRVLPLAMPGAALPAVESVPEPAPAPPTAAEAEPEAEAPAAAAVDAPAAGLAGGPGDAPVDFPLDAPVDVPVGLAVDVPLDVPLDALAEGDPGLPDIVLDGEGGAFIPIKAEPALPALPSLDLDLDLGLPQAAEAPLVSEVASEAASEAASEVASARVPEPLPLPEALPLPVPLADLSLDLSQPEPAAAQDQAAPAQPPLPERDAAADQRLVLQVPTLQPIVEPLVEPLQDPGAQTPSWDAPASVPAQGLGEPEAAPQEGAPQEAAPILAEADLPPAHAEPALQPLAAEDSIKVVGPLRIDIGMFNIFLNEADELSRRLSMGLAEWAIEARQPPGEAVTVMAHSLAGSSATVGFADLSLLSRALEHALTRSNRALSVGLSEGELFNEVATDIRRLLHQFAAGFLVAPRAGLLERLEAHQPPAVAAASEELGHDDEDAADALPQDAAADVEAAEAADAGASASAEETQAAPAEPFEAPVIESVIEPVTESITEPVAEPVAEPITEPSAESVDQPEVEPSAAAIGDADAEPSSALPLALPAGAALAAGALLAPLLPEDDDIDVEDHIDAELFPVFSEEAEELLPQLQAQMRAWVQHPPQRTAAAACMRLLHTFKGGSRLAGAMHLGEMAHRLETRVERLLGSETPDVADIEPLTWRVDALQARFLALRQSLSEAEQASAAEPKAAEAAGPALPQSLDASADESADPWGIDWGPFLAAAAPGGLPPARVSLPAAAQGAVRVRATLLDRLVNHAGEVSIARTRMEADLGQIKSSLGDLSENLDRLRRQLRDVEVQAESQISSRLEAAKAAAVEFDPLEMDRYTRVQELTRMMAESVNDVATVQRSLQRALQSSEDQIAQQGRLTRSMQDDLLRTRMVEFESLSERLYRVVRQAGKETGRQVRLDIVGGSMEIDRGVLERMTAPFEHLLRNSIAHGIETPARRIAAGKDATGLIEIKLTPEGNEVAIEFRDDGAGFDLERIRARALTQGLTDAGPPMSDEALADLIFSPGFSTADRVTELAGRGVGLDVVRSEVLALGGRVQVDLRSGPGACFRMVLPLTTAVTQVVMLRCGELTVAVPANLIEIVRREAASAVEQAYRQGFWLHAGESLPFHWLAALLGGEPAGAAAGRTVPVVIVRSAAQRVALHVDEVLGNQEVVVKNLGPQLSRLPGLAGMTLLASGTVAPIYNPVALVAWYGTAARQRLLQLLASRPEQGPAMPQRPVVPLAPLVLVVDDSLTVRRVTQRLLLREGYRVVTAKDGLEALERIGEELPRVILSDIEMPRMDGFDFVRNLRADPQLSGLPVIMITSRIAQKHRDYARELGVRHYLGKPYGEEELLGLVAQLVRRESLPA